jgi:hypothetical protein
LAVRLQHVEDTPLLKGEKVIKTMIQCAVMNQIAANGAKFLKRHEILFNDARVREMDAERAKVNAKAAKEAAWAAAQEEKKRVAEEVRLDEMLRLGKKIPAMLGSPQYLAEQQSARESRPEGPVGSVGRAKSGDQNPVKDGAGGGVTGSGAGQGGRQQQAVRGRRVMD